MCEFHYFAWQQNEGRWRSRNLVNDDPKVAHDFVERLPKWNWDSFAQRLDLDTDEPLTVPAIGHNVKSPVRYARLA